MKKYILIIAIWHLHLDATSQTLASELYEYKSAYSDEFNSFNGNLWRTNGWNPQTQQMGEWCQEGTWFINSCVSFANGKLRITPNIGSFVQGCGTYKSGCLTSNNYFLYGYYETSVKMPAQPLNAISSWWNTGGCLAGYWPNALYNEIDVFETGDATHPYGAVLYGTSNCAYETNYTNHDYAGRAKVADMTTSFHTFGLEWTPDIINLYFDGNIFRSISVLNWTKGPNNDNGKIGEYVYVNKLTTPVNFLFWVKKDMYNNGNYPDGTKSLEAEYFHYYKPKPFLKDVISSSNNSLVLAASSVVSGEAYNWIVNSGNLSLVNQSAGTATFSIPSGFSTSTISVSATGGYPNTTATSAFEVNSSNGNFCTLSGLGSTPILYFAADVYAPQSGCSSTVVPSGKNVTFVGHNSVTLNPGFEVQLGATFSAF